LLHHLIDFSLSTTLVKKTSSFNTSPSISSASDIMELSFSSDSFQHPLFFNAKQDAAFSPSYDPTMYCTLDGDGLPYS
jgi:hypothetical protein